MKVSLIGICIFLIVQMIIILEPISFILPVLVLFGFFGTAGILSYAALPQNFPPEMAGRVITGLNVFTFGGAFAAQWGMGLIINLWSSPDIGGNYSPASYQAAFTMMFVIQVAGLAWYLIFHRAKV